MEFKTHYQKYYKISTKRLGINLIQGRMKFSYKDKIHLTFSCTNTFIQLTFCTESKHLTCNKAITLELNLCILCLEH